jgi:hypothetical protein
MAAKKNPIPPSPNEPAEEISMAIAPDALASDDTVQTEETPQTSSVEPDAYPCRVRLTNNTPLSMPFPELRVNQLGVSAHLLLRGNTQVSSHPNTVEVEFANADQFKRFQADVAGFEELHGFVRAVKVELIGQEPS